MDRILHFGDEGAKLHLVSESASRRRSARACQIHDVAQELTLEHGYHGWTLADLAERVGVSRRTLFNHVESKEQAVLGPRPVVDEDALVLFRQGGPTGRVLHDAVHLAMSLISANEPGPADLRRFQRVLLSDPALAEAAMRGLAEVLEDLVLRSADRPGITPETARLAFDLTLGLVRHAGEETTGESSTTTLNTRLRELLPLVDEIVAPHPQAADS